MVSAYCLTRCCLTYQTQSSYVGLRLPAGADATVAMQYGYSYDINNGVTPYSAAQTSQNSHKPAIKIPGGTTASFSTSVGFQPSLKAGLKGSILWSVASGNVVTLPAVALTRHLLIEQHSSMCHVCYLTGVNASIQYGSHHACTLTGLHSIL